MTDSMGALHALNHAEHVARDQCLKVFHDRSDQYPGHGQVVWPAGNVSAS
jgi:hypothetical protein